MLCGECKKDIAEKLNAFLAVHQERREKAKGTVEQYRIKRK
jgi:tryptophanyl-tRNA synthetase